MAGGAGPRCTSERVSTSSFDSSACKTVVIVAITTSLRRAEAPGNVSLPRRTAGLTAESVVNVSQLATIDKEMLTARLGVMPASLMAEVDAGLRLVLDI